MSGRSHLSGPVRSRSASSYKGRHTSPEARENSQLSERWRLPLEACGAAASGRWSDPGRASPSAAPSLPSVSRAACGYAGASPSLCQCVFLDQFLRFLLFFCVYVFFILVHHPGSKIKRSDSSSSISSQSPIGWLLSFVPLTHVLAR